jgi:hypothetical protein
LRFIFSIILTFAAQLSKKYLSIPASQASCERLFSVAVQDVTNQRTSMAADLVEAVLFVGKREFIEKI